METICQSKSQHTTLILVFFTILLLTFNPVSAQVSFTQTSNGDFLSGSQHQVKISGGNVYLPQQATNVNNWLSTNAIPVSLQGHQASRWNNYVYLTGGSDGTDTTNSVYRATVQGSGVSGWTAYDTLPVRVTEHAAVIAINQIYILGGLVNGAPSDQIWHATINANGAPGPWTLSATTLPQPLWGHSAEFVNGYIYVMGGTNLTNENSALNTVYYAKKSSVMADLTNFSSLPDLPDARNHHTSGQYDNRLYVLGGIDNSGTKQNTVFYTDLSMDGSCTSWQTMTSTLPVSISHHATTEYNGLLSVIGGEDNSSVSNKVYFAMPDDFPALNWQTATDSLYERRMNGAAFYGDGQMIFAGGENLAGAEVNTTRYCPLTLDADRIHKGTFISYPFMELGEERLIDNLNYNITYNNAYNNYELYYRTAGSDQMWGNWISAGQDNPAMVNTTAQYIQYLMMFDGSDDDDVQLHDMTVEIAGYTQLSGNLNSWDTLFASGSPYWATGNISFTGGSHYIEKGVTILFSPNTGLEIGQANLFCYGMAGDSIYFTSYNGDMGLWNGIYFNSGSDNGVSSQLNYVVIEKAGNGSNNANLRCENTNEPQLTHASIRLADGYGIDLSGSGLAIEHTDVRNNTGHGIRLNNSSPGFISCNISGNGMAGVRLQNTSSNPSYFNCNIDNNTYGLYYPGPNYSFQMPSGIVSYTNLISGIAMDGGEITSNQTWHHSPDGYTVLGDIAIVKKNSHVTLTIAPGNTIRFDTTVQVQIGKYEHYQNEYGGELYAVGTADSLITFTSLSGQPGGWDGIFFHYNSDSFGSESELHYCSIKNGSAFNIMCSNTIEPRIDNCEILNALGNQIYAENPNSVPHVTASSSTISIGAGTQSIDRTWYNFGGEYHVLGDIIVAKKDSRSRLTIQPGITVRFDTATMLQVGHYTHYQNHYGGELYAQGNADSLITFTSMGGTKATWDGIFFHYNSDSFNSHSFLEYCTVDNGEVYNLRVDETLEPRIDNCNIINAGQFDVLVDDPNSVPHITNSTTTVFVSGGTQSIDKTWYNYGGDYVILTNFVVGKHSNKSRLTIEPGVMVKIDTSARIQIGKYEHYLNQYGGEIHAIGNADSLITFTSYNGQVGGWEGMYFHYNSDSFGSESFLDYCVVEKGNAYNIQSSDSREPTISNSTINNCNGYDIHAANPNSVQEVFNTNSTLYIGGGTQGIDITWHSFGGEYVVVGDIIVGKVNTHCRLTVEPGNIINFDSGTGLQIGKYEHYLQYFGGELYTMGTHDSLIIFQPWDQSNGGWDGVYFHDYSDSFGATSELIYTVIREADNYNIRCINTNQPAFEHASIVNSGDIGLYLENSSPYVRLSQIIQNDSIGIYLTSNSQPVIGDTVGYGCDFYDNGDYDIYNNTSKHIYARNNFWNNTDSAAIAGRIHDNFDQGSLGIVEFMPMSASSFFTNNTPGNFSLLSLPDNAVTTDQQPDFSWQPSIDPDGDEVSYKLYYTTDSTWATGVNISPELDTNIYTIPETLTGGSWYWWKVRANDVYLSKFSNETWKFAVSLPPSIPAPIAPNNGVSVDENDYLVWIKSTDPDAGDYISHYHLQIDDDADFSSPVIDTTGIDDLTETSALAIRFNDLNGFLNLENKLYYWRVSAIDKFSVESDFSDGSNYFYYLLDMNITVFLDGPFTGALMNTALNANGYIPLDQPYNMLPWNYQGIENVSSIPNADIVDWILLELRETDGGPGSATAATNIFTKAVFLKNDGSVVDLDGSNGLNFPVSFDEDVYVVIHHRNHLSIISQNPITPNEGSYSYDFSLGAGQVFGGSLGYREIGNGVWGLAGGDGNADGQINNSDKNNVWAPEAGSAGYLYGDFTLDGQVNNSDKNDVWAPNSGGGSQVPDSLSEGLQSQVPK